MRIRVPVLDPALVPGSSPVPGPWSWVPGPWSWVLVLVLLLVPGPWSLVRGPWSWSLVPGPWSVVLVPGLISVQVQTSQIPVQTFKHNSKHRNASPVIENTCPHIQNTSPDTPKQHHSCKTDVVMYLHVLFTYFCVIY